MATSNEYLDSIITMADRIRKGLEQGATLTDSDVQELRKIDASLSEMADYAENQ